MRKTELLIPAGSLDVLKTAVIYGADAVYIGGEAFGLRAKAHNFSLEDMKGAKTIEYKSFHTICPSKEVFSRSSNVKSYPVQL